MFSCEYSMYTQTSVPFFADLTLRWRARAIYGQRCKFLNLLPYRWKSRGKGHIEVNRGWSGGAKVLGKLPVPGRPTIWITVGQGPTALAVGAGGGCLDIFTLIYPVFLLSPSLWETARYRLKYCLKGPLNPKQPTIEVNSYGKLRCGLPAKGQSHRECEIKPECNCR